MRRAKTYAGDKLTVHFTYSIKDFPPAKLTKFKAGMSVFLQVLDVWLKPYRGVKKFSIELSLISDASMKKINFKHRGKNSTTDVLSFPMEEDVRKMKKFKAPELFLGDIVISKQVTRAQAKDFNISFEREFFHLFTHGLLHLMGYDHERNASEEKRMFSLERKLVKSMVVQLPNL